MPNNSEEGAGRGKTGNGLRFQRFEQDLCFVLTGTVNMSGGTKISRDGPTFQFSGPSRLIALPVETGTPYPGKEGFAAYLKKKKKQNCFFLSKETSFSEFPLVPPGAARNSWYLIEAH